MTTLTGKSIGFIGLGAIGAPLAGHLVRNGATVRVYNRSEAKQNAWLSQYPEAKGVRSGAEVADGANYVISCVGNDDDLRTVYYGRNGVIRSLSPGMCIIDHTTASNAIAIELDTQISQGGGTFVDAPVSGGSVGAENGALSIMVGGSQAAFSAAEPILQIYGKSINHIGPAGAGQLCKMVNQVCIAGILEGLAEGLALATKAGLDPERVLQAISNGAAGSWQMNNRSSFMLSGQYRAGFAARLMYKDLGLALQAAHNRGLNLPVTKVVEDRYAKLLKMKLGDEDFSNLFRLVSGQ